MHEQVISESAEQRLAAAEEALRQSEARHAADLAGLQRLYEINVRLADVQDLRTWLEEIVEASNDFLGTDRGCIQLVSEDRQRLEMFAYRGYGPDSPFIRHFLHAGSKPACDAARANRTRLVIEDVQTFPALDGTRDREVATEEGIRATQSTPMVTRSGEMVGVLNNQFRAPHRPNADQLRLIDLLAWNAAEIVERHRAGSALLDREAWLAGQKGAFEAALRGAPLDEVLNMLVQTAVTQLGKDARCAFYLADPTGRELTHVTGMPEPYARCVDGFKISADSLACGLAVYNGEPVITVDVRDEPRWQPWLWLAEQYDYRAVWSFPVETTTRKVVGTFAVYFVAPRAASPRDHALASGLTRAAAIIIARHQEAQERARAEASLRENEARQRVLVAEVQHRARNLLGVVTAVAGRTLRQGSPVEAFEDRLQALSRAHGLLSQAGSDMVEVGALVRAELAAHADADSPHVDVTGPTVHVTARQVQNFALALHELTTNAVKYGALKTVGGRLAVTWEVVPGRHERRRLALSWVESGVTIEPDKAARRGYGTELIREALAYALQATVDYRLGPDGVQCRIELPLS